MALKPNSYSGRERKAAGGAGRRNWKHDLIDDLPVRSQDAHCAHCDHEFDGGDEVVSRGGEYDDIFCSVGCGALRERELASCYDAAQAARQVA